MTAKLLTSKERNHGGNGGPPNGSIVIPASAVTHPGFRAWVKSDDFPEQLRVSYIRQRIFLDMSKEELETHNKVKSELARVLLNLNRRAKLGVFYGDGALVTNEEAGLSTNPDGTFLLKSSLQSRRARLISREGAEGHFIEIVGSPDWLLEVVSNSSVHKDTVELPKVYHRARVSEYWLIDARGAEIAFQIYHWRKAGYVAVPKRSGWLRSRVFACSFRLTRQRDDLGLWEYTLESRDA